MVSTIDLDRPNAHPPLRDNGRRRRFWLIAATAVVGAAVTTALTAGAYVYTHAGNQPLPAGAHTVEVYTVEDAISTTVPPEDRPGAIGRFIGMCDADTHYIEVG